MDNKYVSRGGLKLEHALRSFDIDAGDLVVLDAGSSTGGFVDCLLKKGAAKIYSIDTAYGELAWTLRKDPRVVVMERQNILHLTDLPELVDLVTIDVTFTPVIKIVAALKSFLKPNGKVIALVKPQYEDSKLALKNKGITPIESTEKILENVIDLCGQNGWKLLNKTDSPILGKDGNKEFLILLCKSQN